MFTRKFTLRHTFDEISELYSHDGPEETHFGVTWNILVEQRPKSEDEDELFVGVYLGCCKPGDKKNSWSVSVKGTLRIENGNEEDNIEKKFEKTYGNNEYNYEIGNVCNWETMMEKYVKNDKLTVEIDVIITEIKGIIPKRKLNFDEPEEHKTDMVLIVGNEKFNVLKGMLARFSDYFSALFFNGCKESQQAEIKLEEVDPDTFHMILEIIHGELDCIKNGTVEQILDLARQYQIGAVTKRCVDFMINKTDVDQEEKFRLASVYNLVDLQDHLLQDIKSSKDADNRLKRSVNHMNNDFIAKMIRKVYK